MPIQWENLKGPKNNKALCVAILAGVCGLDFAYDAFTGNIIGSATSLVTALFLWGYMGYLNQTGNFCPTVTPQTPKPARA